MLTVIPVWGRWVDSAQTAIASLTVCCDRHQPDWHSGRNELIAVVYEGMADALVSSMNQMCNHLTMNDRGAGERANYDRK